MIHTINGFSIVNEIDIGVFLKFPCFLCDAMNVSSFIWFLCFSKPSLDIWKFLVRIILKPSTQDFKHDLTSMEDECSCPII